MFLELFNDLLINSSAFYVYFGMLIMTIGISQLLMIHRSVRGPQTNFSFHDVQQATPNETSFGQPLASHELFIRWFVKSFKRIDKPDDDQEDESDSYFNSSFEIRGGQLWRKTTYSQPYGNIGSLLSQ